MIIFPRIKTYIIFIYTLIFKNIYRKILANLDFGDFIFSRKKNFFFWKKESRTFDLIEPSHELSIKKYMTWFLLKCKYDKAKF